ncbi:MAG: hypothetical protein AB8G95_05725 [Anaerolineae bacterium]
MSSVSGVEKSDFIPIGSGASELIELKVGNSVNRVYTPPPNQFQRAPQTATINVNYNPASCENEMMADVTPWPSNAQAAFSFATNIWGSLITSSVPIEVDACWRELGIGVLGSARALNGFTDGQVVYPVALANAIEGVDLDLGTSDIQANFSSEFSWYLGTDGNTPSSQLDFVSVVLHEVGHGLGFAGSMEVGTLTQGGPLVGRWGFGFGIPSSYDAFVENGSNQSIINTAIFPNPSEALFQQVTSGNLFFDGPFSRAANGNAPVALYAPAQWSQGSSFSHLAESFNGTSSALMTFSLDSGEARHSPGPVGLALLNDVGWGSIESVVPTPSPTNTPVATTPPNTPTPVTPVSTATPSPEVTSVPIQLTEFWYLPLTFRSSR